MPKISLYSFIFSIQYRLIISTFVIIGLGISILIGYFTSALFDLKLGFFFGLILSLITCILTVFLSSIIDFQKINSAYDDIRNLVSDPDAHVDCKTFSKLFNDFIIKHFKGSIFPVEFSFVKLLRHNIVYSSTEFSENFTQDIKNKIYSHCETRSDLFCHTILIKNIKHDLFVIPIVLYNKHLGFWGISRKSSMFSNIQFYKDLIQDVENKLLDDQAASVIQFEKFTVWRDFLLEADTLSNRISQQKYNTLDDYIIDILKITIKLTGCTAAAMETIYSDNYIWAKHPDADEFDKLQNKFSVCDTSSALVIHERRHPKIKHVLSVPIMIETLTGILYLFDNTKEKLEFYRLILSDLENIKIDNDLSWLAEHLNLSPTHKLLP